jgi:hypothetical protein
MIILFIIPIVILVYVLAKKYFMYKEDKQYEESIKKDTHLCCNEDCEHCPYN